MLAQVAPVPQPRNKVMVCDDLKVNRIILSRMFRKLGFDVIEAENGQECIQRMVQEHAAVLCVVLDLIMPILNGWQTCQQLRLLQQEHAWGELPVFACTAESLDPPAEGASVPQKCAIVGFDDCMCKPVTLGLLCETLKKHVPTFDHALLAGEGGNKRRHLIVDQTSNAKLHKHARQLLSNASAANTMQITAEQFPRPTQNSRRTSIDTKAGAAYYYQTRQAVEQRRCSSEFCRQ